MHSINSDLLLSPQYLCFMSLQGQNHIAWLPLKSQHFRKVSHAKSFKINVVISNTMEIVVGISGIAPWVAVLDVLKVFFLMVTKVLVRDTYLPSQNC